MRTSRSKEESRRMHPSNRTRVVQPPPAPESLTAVEPAGKGEDLPVVDTFLEALREVQRCRLQFGSWPLFVDPELERLDEARRAVARAWRADAA